MDNLHYEPCHTDTGKCYVVNAPLLARLAWGIVNKFMDPVTRAKVVMLGSDYKSVLPQYIDSDQLPPEYGGTCSSCNGECVPVPLYTLGAPVPKSPYIEQEDGSLSGT